MDPTVGLELFNNFFWHFFSKGAGSNDYEKPNDTGYAVYISE
jgi:hypothetical protein